MVRIGRNSPCPCGSGKKYKRCCGDPLTEQRQSPPIPDLASVVQRHKSDEIIRVSQQGKGRPIVSTKFNDYTFVATGKTLHWSKKWKTFTDFLCDYIKRTLGHDWGNVEISKPYEKRHPILQWYDVFCRQQHEFGKKDGELYSAPITGVMSCYLGLAYNLYLLDHNVELQNRLVSRLKDLKQFQGAYYELIVANCLIRAGFELELEDEDNSDTKHCEFSAKSQATGRRYWVEAKTRSVPGILGKTSVDGSKSKDPTSRISAHLRGALQKPAPDERIIFLDLNTELSLGLDKPVWFNQAVRRLEARERDLEENQRAYVFVTNMAFHRMPHSQNARAEAFAYGLGIPDFGKSGEIRLSDWYRQKQKHIDAYNVFDTLKSYPQIPETFDGHPVSEALYNSPRLRVGETYFFEDAGGVVGTVTSAAVIETEKCVYVSIMPSSGTSSMILKAALSDRELEDYKKYGNAYFGESEIRRNECSDIFEFYEWLVSCYLKTPRKRLLELAQGHPEFEQLVSLETEEIVLKLCEGWAASMDAMH